nr:hypothetical protein [Tanacetum cinerariifolium]
VKGARMNDRLDLISLNQCLTKMFEGRSKHVDVFAHSYKMSIEGAQRLKFSSNRVCSFVSSVEDLVPIPSEFEGISDNTCDVPFCDNSPPLDVLNDHFELFFYFNDDCTSYFTSSDDESLSNEDVPEDNVKIYSNPLFEFDDEYISSDVNPLFDEVLEDIECKDPYDSNLDESTFLVTPLSDVNEDECFDPGGDVDEINDFEDDHDTKSLKDESVIDESKNMVKNFDPRIPEKFFSLTYDCLDFEDSRARGFVLRSLELQSLAYGNPIS